MADIAQHDTRSEPRVSVVAMGYGSINRRAAGWFGVLTLILTEAALFGYLLFSYYFLAIQGGSDWLPREMPSFRLSGPNTAILIISSVCVWFGEHGARQSSRWRTVLGLGAGLVLGIIFVTIQVFEWLDKPFQINSNAYGSLFFTVTGFHMAHVVAGLFVLAPLTLWSGLGYFNAERHAPVSIGAIYWHFVDVVWLAVFFTFYITPYLLS